MAKILIGFMGAGKSTIARLLDENYVDMDAILTERIGMTISEYFSKEGEDSFRALESELLEELLETDKVVSSGGGIVKNERNRELLSQNQETIYLEADFDTLYKRISNDKENKRPLFITNSRSDFKAIFEERKVWYEDSCTRKIDVTSKLPEEIVKEIQGI